MPLRRLAVVGAGLALVLAGAGAAPQADARPASPGGSRSPVVTTHHGQRLVAEPSLRAASTDENFYFVMADRFENGDEKNDTGGLGSDPLVSGFDPTSKGFYQGGDLKGIRKKLGYIQKLGTTSIWLTPSFKNKAVQLEDGPSAGYHGYWITDFTQIDPHLGTNQDLRDLVDAAHKRGMKVYFDIITNHTADVIGYEQGARTAYVSKDISPYQTASGRPFDDRDYAGTNRFPALSAQTSFPYTPVLDDAEKNLKVPSWLNDVTLYHNRGNTTFTGEDSQYGDFAGLDDLFTENPKVVNGMIDIYETWIKEMSIDGFRIDTMKHVDDAFWQEFGPQVLAYAKSQGKKDFFMFGEVYDTTKSFTSQYTTRNKMQSVLDFPFQDAARSYASKGGTAQALDTFFKDDDWYTDADSNAYQLPTFLGNHDMGRIGYFVTADNPGASDAQLLQRDQLAHELMYFSRGNPVIYYGDEQGFTGTGGDQLARQTMFASQVPDYQDDKLLGTDRTNATDSFLTDSPLYTTISQLAAVTKAHPALRNGTHQSRYASDGPGIYAFSRMLRGEQREYVVALNNSTEAKTASIPTYAANAAYDKVYGSGSSRLTTDRARALRVTVPALSTVVYESARRVPASTSAPSISLGEPKPAAQANSRMQVTADVSGSGFNEVTFYAKVGRGDWQSIGTDDNRPYRVFHDLGGARSGQVVSYRAVVRDNAGHTRVASLERAIVPRPKVSIDSPAADGAGVFGTLTVSATVDPEKATNVVRLQRSLDGGAWQTLTIDSSSPVYSYVDDLASVPVGTQIRYRALLSTPDGTTSQSAIRTVRRVAPTPLVSSVTLAGSLQSEIGCPGDWQPDCTASHLTFDASDGLWKGTWTLPAGSYEYKVAINNSWDVNYGAGGAAGGSNLTLTVPAGGASVTFTWDQVSHIVSHRIG